MAKDEVLIVGAGPVGLTLAIQLARYGVKFRIIDKSAMQTEDSRAAGIHPRTLEVFEDLGLIDTFLEQGVSVAGINLYSHKKRLIHAVYGGLDSRYPHILDLPQSQTEQILLKRFEALGGLLLFSGKMPQETELKTLSQLYQMGSDTLQPYLIYRNESDLTHCPQKDHCLYDHEPSAHTHYGIEKEAVVIVHPDGIVGMIQSFPDPKGVQTYLKKVFKTL